VKLDTTNSGGAPGADITLLTDGTNSGQIKAFDSALDSQLNLTAGQGDISLGDITNDSLINNLTVVSANNVNFNDVFIAGNTLDVSSTGNVTISGTISDSAGDVSIVTNGLISVAQDVSAQGSISLTSNSSGVSVQGVTAGSDVDISASTDIAVAGNTSGISGSVTVISSGGSVNTIGDISGGVNVAVVADKDILLGSNTTGAGGTVTLVSNTGSIQSVDTVAAGSDIIIRASGNVSLSSTGTSALEAGGDADIVAGSGDLLLNANVTSSGDFAAFSLEGKVAQAKDTLLSAGGNVTLSGETGLEIASINAVQDVTLVITQTEAVVGEDGPTFQRVNDPIPFGQGDTNQDVSSDSGTIVFLAPVASVGSTDASQNFVQRAAQGIFYGLNEGQFFSDDIGNTQVLVTIPAATTANLSSVTNDVLDPGSLDTSLGVSPTIFNVSVAEFNSGVSNTSVSAASAGETSAASSSRSTAASQQEDEEEVSEVDEVAFERTLKNYDDNPQGILLPEEQRFSYDENGNIYFSVTLRKNESDVHRDGQRDGQGNGETETFTLYRVNLDLHSQTSEHVSSNEEEGSRVPGLEEASGKAFGYKPSFMKLTMNEADNLNEREG
jgi:hypothetical protein